MKWTGELQPQGFGFSLSSGERAKNLHFWQVLGSCSWCWPREFTLKTSQCWSRLLWNLLNDAYLSHTGGANQRLRDLPWSNNYGVSREGNVNISTYMLPRRAWCWYPHLGELKGLQTLWGFLPLHTEWCHNSFLGWHWFVKLLLFL